MNAKCPGQDTRYWKAEDIHEEECPYCGNMMEFFKTDVRLRCRNCGNKVANPRFDLGCAEWCSFAEYCVGQVKKGYEPETIKDILNDEAGKYLDQSQLEGLKEAQKKAEEEVASQGAEAMLVNLALYLWLVELNRGKESVNEALKNLKKLPALPKNTYQEINKILEELRSQKVEDVNAWVVKESLRGVGIWQEDNQEAEKTGRMEDKRMNKKRVRQIVKIDEEKCDGCGQCVPACAEGAIQIIDGKARLVKESLCDGLGACLGDCPRGAMTLVEEEAEEFDEEEVEKHLQNLEEEKSGKEQGKTVQEEAKDPVKERVSCSFSGYQAKTVKDEGSGGKEETLSHWPVQLHLVPREAAFLENTRYVIAADCTSFAYPGFHRELLQGGALLIGCPKLDDAAEYQDKLTDIFKKWPVQEVTVVLMEVPCCSGLYRLVEQAREDAGASFLLNAVVIGINGEIKEEI